MSLEDDEKLILANSKTLRDAGVGKNQRHSPKVTKRSKKKKKKELDAQQAP